MAMFFQQILYTMLWYTIEASKTLFTIDDNLFFINLDTIDSNYP